MYSPRIFPYDCTLEDAVQKLSESTLNPFTESDDDWEIARALFDFIDTDKSRTISHKELSDALSHYNTDAHRDLADALKALMSQNAQREGEATRSPESLTFDSFFEAIGKLPRVRGQRVQWATSLRLDSELARFVKPGDIFDGLRGLKEMTDCDLVAHVYEMCSKFASNLPGIIFRNLMQLRKAELPTAEAFLNSKFSMEGSFIGKFASLHDFYEGPDALIGAPNPKVYVGMEKEHCGRSNAAHKIITPNYNIATTPREEWQVVVCPVDGYCYPHTPRDKRLWKEDCGWKGECGRDVEQVDLFLKDPTNCQIVASAKLTRDEVIGLRLYTGPMYILYNSVLRGFPEKEVTALKGNRYETTIFCITSGIMKLSKVTEVPADRRLYRGLGGMILPDQFWKENREEGFRGGVEFGLMSTTRNRNVAIQYSGVRQQRGTVFEISAGRIDVGADLSWVSQYPGEEEFLFPPLSCLEVAGEPRVMDGVIVISLRANINLKALTLEQLVERRKNLHLAMTKNLIEDLAFEAASKIADFEVDL